MRVNPGGCIVVVLTAVMVRERDGAWVCDVL